MKLRNLIKIKGFVVTTLISVSVLVLGFAAQALAAEPGTNEDPLVSKSYVDSKVTELQKKNDELKALLDNQPKTQSFTVVDLKKGQKIITGASSEIIVRAGKATAISSAAGGLADFTADISKDYLTGQLLPTNHLLLVSRDDGRGLTAVDDIVYLMVKGTYTIN